MPGDFSIRESFSNLVDTVKNSDTGKLLAKHVPAYAKKSVEALKTGAQWVGTENTNLYTVAKKGAELGKSAMMKGKNAVSKGTEKLGQKFKFKQHTSDRTGILKKTNYSPKMNQLPAKSDEDIAQELLKGSHRKKSDDPVNDLKDNIPSKHLDGTIEKQQKWEKATAYTQSVLDKFSNHEEPKNEVVESPTQSPSEKKGVRFNAQVTEKKFDKDHKQGITARKDIDTRPVEEKYKDQGVLLNRRNPKVINEREDRVVYNYQVRVEHNNKVSSTKALLESGKPIKTDTALNMLAAGLQDGRKTLLTNAFNNAVYNDDGTKKKYNNVDEFLKAVHKEGEKLLKSPHTKITREEFKEANGIKKSFMLPGAKTDSESYRKMIQLQKDFNTGAWKDSPMPPEGLTQDELRAFDENDPNAKELSYAESVGLYDEDAKKFLDSLEKNSSKSIDSAVKEVRKNMTPEAQEELMSRPPKDEKEADMQDFINATQKAMDNKAVLTRMLEDNDMLEK